MPDFNPRRTLHVLLVAVGLLALLVCPAGATAAPDKLHLRPNDDLRLGGWDVVGAGSAWQALDDEVTKSDWPSGDDYVLDGASTLWLGLETTSLADVNVARAKAWIYTPDANAVTLEVRERPGRRLAIGTFATPGWHSVSVPLADRQSRLDRTIFGLRGESNVEAERATVDAAYLRLRLAREEPPPTPPPVDPSGPQVYWGAWMDGEVYGGGQGDAPWSGTTWDSFEQHAGKPVSIVHFGQPAPWNQAFDPSTQGLIDERGAIPLLDMDSDGVASSSIASGAYDSFLRSWASAVASDGDPFFFRWEWEMNGTWFPWGAEAARDPEAYVSAWQRFHDIAEAQGATNITWVWCPNTIHPGSTPLASLYPDDAYVDWTCIDGYNFGEHPSQPSGWTSFYDLFAPTYEALTSLAPSKPIMIGETGSTEIGGSKSTWIANALGEAIPRRFPQIKAVNWFNWNIYEGGGRRDWPIESSSASQAAFAEAISSPYYAANGFGDLPPLTRVQPLP